MQINAKIEYSLRALAELSTDSEPVSVREVCEKQNLPFKYIEQLFSKLKKKGIITSAHGTKGGYLLAKEANKISLLEVMNAVEEEVYPFSCDQDDNLRCFCAGKPCICHDLLKEIHTHFHDYFASISLDRLQSNKE